MLQVGNIKRNITAAVICGEQRKEPDEPPEAYRISDKKKSPDCHTSLRTGSQ